MRGEVDAATNAETQSLRQSIDDPSRRVIFTEAESFLPHRGAALLRNRIREAKRRALVGFPESLVTAR